MPIALFCILPICIDYSKSNTKDYKELLRIMRVHGMLADLYIFQLSKQIQTLSFIYSFTLTFIIIVIINIKIESVLYSTIICNLSN